NTKSYCYNNQCVECLNDSHCSSDSCEDYDECPPQLIPFDNPSCQLEQERECTSFRCDSTNTCVPDNTYTETRNCNLPDGTNCDCKINGNSQIGKCEQAQCRSALGNEVCD